MIGQRKQNCRQASAARKVIHVFFFFVIAPSLAIPLEEKGLADDGLVLDEVVIENVRHPDVPKYLNWPFSVQYQAPQVRVRLINSLIPPSGGCFYLRPSTAKRDTKYYYDASELSSEIMEQPEREGRRYEELIDGQVGNRQSVVPSENDDTKDEVRNVAEDPGNSPVISSRNIITAPTICPVGYRKDRKGVCRPVIKM